MIEHKNMLSEKDTQIVYEILTKELCIPREQLLPNAKIKEDLGADSLTLAEIALAVEERFNLSVSDEQWESISTVGDVFDLLTNLQAAENCQNFAKSK